MINTDNSVTSDKESVLTYLSESKKWQRQLEKNENGKILKTYENARIIFENDSSIRNMIHYNIFSQNIEVDPAPYWRNKHELSQNWNDSDDGELKAHFEREYGIQFSRESLSDIVDHESRQNAYHPIKTFVEREKWDGRERVETIFIDYLGAEDSHYTRQVARKWLIAGIKRTYEAGCKYDEMPVLYGKQGAGKSHLASRLGGEWFNESLKTFKGEEPLRMIQGSWIVEIAELSAMGVSTIEEIKAFLSTRVDKFRQPYARYQTEAPRQCIFIGTTNTHDFLKDQSGNRRFLPIAVGVNEHYKSPFNDDLSDKIVQQIWAEAYYYYSKGESTLLDVEADKIAKEMQEYHSEDDPLMGLIEEFLKRPITEKYWDLDVYQKRDMVYTETYADSIEKNKTYKRDKTCALEIWKVALGNINKMPKQHETRKINQALDRLDICSKDNIPKRFGQNIGLQRGYSVELH